MRRRAIAFIAVLLVAGAGLSALVWSFGTAKERPEIAHDLPRSVVAATAEFSRRLAAAFPA